MNKHYLKFLAGGTFILALVLMGLWWVRDRERNVSTTDAFMTARPHMVTTRIPGVVTKIYVHDNQIVHPGDLLLELDPKDVLARLDVERADLVSVTRKIPLDVSQMRIAEQNLLKAQSDRDRGVVLSRGGYATEEDLEHLDVALRIAHHELSKAKKQISLDRAMVKKMQAALAADLLNKHYLKIVSDVSGRFTNRTASLGMYVSPGLSLATIIPFHTWVIANMKETRITHMKVGDPVTIHVDAYPDRVFKGKVESIQQATGAIMALLPPENATGNFTKVVQRVPVRIALLPDSDPDHLLIPGLSVVPTVHVDPSYHPAFGH
ncbi:HlyD family secretion protein [Leptospirillum ferrooxidans]|uniref:Putative secretion protein n=1 Tax=Leptospirillum ferrooxidans (strain C2-3) TaxID=1162668 RepID=I0IPF7_LEPFC|nr:HlyD family secretion protein [Leptospirillum ferrooxidans]BAM07156.1 putative secretion protein [Leptospirillum ferrooxidans C2-3]